MVREAVRIGIATKGTFTLNELKMMSLDLIDVIIKELKDISQEMKEANK